MRAFLPRSKAAVLSSLEDVEASNGLPSNRVQPVEDGGLEEGETDERTPLMARSAPDQTRSNAEVSLRALATSPVMIAAILGLFIGLVKPVQRFLIGSDVRDGDYTGTWRSIGQGLHLLGLSFAVVDILADGSGVRAGEKKR